MTKYSNISIENACYQAMDDLDSKDSKATYLVLTEL